MGSWVRAVLLLQKQATPFLPVHVQHNRDANTAMHTALNLAEGPRACCMHLPFLETATSHRALPTKHRPTYNFCIKLYFFPTYFNGFFFFFK